ncbi:MAG TPA: zinc metalloprotease HtpX [Ornithinibacter sp.]|nr:zinc metalloprotease HtpX [Ornithinibacter sp.]
MATSRFIKDSGLTARMTLTMFLLGAMFVGLVALVISYVNSAGGAVMVAIIAIGMAFWQWWSSDKVAMRAMRAREVTPEEAPELHGLIDRLCALADMPKPRVGVSDLEVPNAFATGRSPDRSVVCVTTGILQTLDTEELEAVLAHELSHVAHRDVLVMTIASSAGIAAGLLMRFTQFGGLGRSRGNNNSALPVALVVLLVSLLVYALSFVMLRVLSRYRELCADRSGAYLTMKPGALASALQKISGESAAAIPTKDLRTANAASALCIVPAFAGGLSGLMATHPPLHQRLEQLARIQAELGRPTG